MSATTTGLDRLIDEYVRKHAGSAAWHARAKEFFPADGATHFARIRVPFRPYITHAKGSRKWDVDGHEYVDYVMGHGALMLGHSHPAIVEAIQAQAAKGVHYGDNHGLEVEWAERIRRLMPVAERVEYTACGQEANMMGIRLSRVFTGRKKILRFKYNYHGWADELAAGGTPGAVADYVTEIPGNNLDAVEKLLATREYAMVLVEGGGAFLSGRVPTTVEFFRGLPALTRKYGTLLLLDEVVTGFREAVGGWQSVIGITPDLTSVGKAVSGGLAAGALLGRSDVLGLLNPNTPAERRVGHGGTWNAVPITCAAGIASCDLYRDGQPQKVAREMGDYLRRQANQVFKRRGANVRLHGRTILHVYFGPIDQEPADDTLPPTTDLAKLNDPKIGPLQGRLDLHLMQRGVASFRGELFVLSGVHTRADIDHTVEALDQAVVAMQEEGSLSA